MDETLLYIEIFLNDNDGVAPYKYKSPERVINNDVSGSLDRV